MVILCMLNTLDGILDLMTKKAMQADCKRLLANHFQKHCHLTTLLHVSSDAFRREAFEHIHVSLLLVLPVTVIKLILLSCIYAR